MLRMLAGSLTQEHLRPESCCCKVLPGAELEAGSRGGSGETSEEAAGQSRGWGQGRTVMAGSDAGGGGDCGEASPRWRSDFFLA